MAPELSSTLENSPEYALVGAILHQAMVDLRATAPPIEQVRSVQLFRNEERHLEMLCSLVNLDHESIQEAVQRQYPQWFATP